jgi:hypothetical protein
MKVEDILEKIHGDGLINGIDAHLKKINFTIAKEVPYSIFKIIDFDSRKIEVAYKTYIIGVLTNDKEMRISSLNAVKEMSPDLLTNLKAFKKQHKFHNENCKNTSCKKDK